MAYRDNLFINCPFDNDYFFLLKPLLFTTIYCGLKPKISETRNSADVRLEEIKQLIQQSRYSIHDLSRIEPLTTGDLPRFNMPFELGIDVGCKTYGDRTDKKYLILEKLPYRYKEILSDISGQDIKSHNNEPRMIVQSIRNWFRSIFPRREITGYTKIWDAYNEFQYDYKEDMEIDNLDPDYIWEIPFSELIFNMKKWIDGYK